MHVANCAISQALAYMKELKGKMSSAYAEKVTIPDADYKAAVDTIAAEKTRYGLEDIEVLPSRALCAPSPKPNRNICEGIGGSNAVRSIQPSIVLCMCACVGASAFMRSCVLCLRACACVRAHLAVV